MTKEAFVFIDGNNLYHNLKDIDIKPSNLNFFKFCDLICKHFNVKRNHIIYYNSIPRRNNPNHYEHKEFLDDLENNGIEVKRRKLQIVSNIFKVKFLELIGDMGLCDICKPIAIKSLIESVNETVEKEKGIDVMIAVDVIQKTVDKECDYCIVVSGDADLVSAMKFAEIKGGKIFSAFLDCKGYSDEIKMNFQYFKIEKKELMKSCLKI